MKEQVSNSISNNTSEGSTTQVGSAMWSKGYIQLKDSKFCMQRWFSIDLESSNVYEYAIWRMNWGGFFLTEKSFTDVGINIKDFNGIVKTSNQLVFTTEEDVKKAVEEYMSKAGRI